MKKICVSGMCSLENVNGIKPNVLRVENFCMDNTHSPLARIGKQSEERAMTDRRRECERRQRCECGRLLVLDHASLPSKGEESTRWRPAAAWSQSHPPLQRSLLFKHENTRDGRPSIAVNGLLLFCPGSR
jgi:hypothetical protein